MLKIKCIRCSGEDVVRAGFRNKKQYYLCKNCKYSFKNDLNDGRVDRKIKYSKTELKENIKAIRRNTPCQVMPNEHSLLKKLQKEYAVSPSESYLYKLLQEINREEGKQPKISNRNTFVFEITLPGLIECKEGCPEIEVFPVKYRLNKYFKKSDKLIFKEFRVISKKIGKTSNGELVKFLLLTLFKVKNMDELLHNNFRIRKAYNIYCLSIKAIRDKSILLNSKKKLDPDSFLKKYKKEINNFEIAKANYLDTFEKELNRCFIKAKNNSNLI